MWLAPGAKQQQLRQCYKIIKMTFASYNIKRVLFVFITFTMLSNKTQSLMQHKANGSGSQQNGSSLATTPPTTNVISDFNNFHKNSLQNSLIDFNPMEMQEQLQLNNEAVRQRLLLHRHKRYLLFIEGSSFQMVFDLIIAIVDFTNFAILGITCAVAWELPSKPPSELLEDLQTRLNDGTLGTTRRNDTITASVPPKYVDTVYYKNRQSTGIGHVEDAYYKANSIRNWHNATTRASQYWQQYANQNAYYHRPSAAYSSNFNNNNNWWMRNKERLEGQWREREQHWNKYSQQQQRSRQYQKEPQRNYNPRAYRQQQQQPQRKLLQMPPKHRIYPVYGRRRRSHADYLKRNIAYDDFESNIERIHLRQHLVTRDLLFRKIERLYKARSMNGTACVLRALCESGQRRLNDEPQSFIMELLNAIFQLPKGQHSLNGGEHISSHYVEAHKMPGNCRQMFQECEHGFWQQKEDIGFFEKKKKLF